MDPFPSSEDISAFVKCMEENLNMSLNPATEPAGGRQNFHPLNGGEQGWGKQHKRYFLNGYDNGAQAHLGSGTTTMNNSACNSGTSTPFSYPATPLVYTRARGDNNTYVSTTDEAHDYHSLPTAPHTQSYGADYFQLDPGNGHHPQDRATMPDCGVDGDSAPGHATKKDKPRGRQSRILSADSVMSSEMDPTSPEKGKGSVRRSKSVANNKQKVDVIGKSATFLTKLYQILESAEYNHMIHWDADGTQIIIERPGDLEQQVLPLVYKQSRFASFSRQLNIYGFMRKVTLRTVDREVTERDASQWSHHSLNRRSLLEDLHNYKRRVPPRIHVRKQSVAISNSAKNPESASSAGAEGTPPATGPELPVTVQTSGPTYPQAGRMTGTLPLPRRVSDTAAGALTARTPLLTAHHASRPSLDGSQPSFHGFQLDTTAKATSQQHYDEIESQTKVLRRDIDKELGLSPTFRLRDPFAQPLSAPSSRNHFFHHHPDIYGSSNGSDITGSGSGGSRGHGIASIPHANDNPPAAFQDMCVSPTDMGGFGRANLPAISYLTQEVDHRSMNHGGGSNTVSSQTYTWPQASSATQVYATANAYMASTPSFGLSHMTFFESSPTSAFPFTPPPDSLVLEGGPFHRPSASLLGSLPLGSQLPLHMQRPGNRKPSDGSFMQWAPTPAGLRNADTWLSNQQAFGRSGEMAKGSMSPLKHGFKVNLSDINLDNQGAQGAGDSAAMMGVDAGDLQGDPAGANDGFSHDEFMLDPDEVINRSWKSEE